MVTNDSVKVAKCVCTIGDPKADFHQHTLNAFKEIAMEVVPDHPLIKLKYSEVEAIRKSVGVNVKDINESIDALLEWAKKQDHLAEAMEHTSRNYLERILILTGGSLEASKKKIEKLFTTRGLMSDLCLNQSLDEHDGFLRCVNVLPLPCLSPKDYTRVLLTKFILDPDAFTILSFYRYCYLLAEYRLQYDYFIGERHIIDLKHVKLSLIGKINPVILKKGEIVATEGYGTKIKGIHLINAPPFVDKLVFILKSTLKEKVASRIHVHSSYEDLHKHIPKEVLPKDYGGDEVSSDKLAELWREALRSEESLENIAQAEKRVSNESKRSSVKFNEEYMGMPGSFKRLNVD